MAKKKPLRKLYLANSVRWKADLDYLGKLSDTDRAWMLDFLDAHYNADFRSDLGEDIPVSERRKIYAEKAAAREDVTARGLAYEAAEYLESDREIEPEPLPDYLNTPSYKDALIEYRKLLAPTRKPRIPESSEKSRAKALEQLAKVKKSGTS